MCIRDRDYRRSNGHGVLLAHWAQDRARRAAEVRRTRQPLGGTCCPAGPPCPGSESARAGPSGTFLAIGFLSGSGGLGVGRKPLLACGYVRVGGRHWAPFRVLPKHGLSAAEGDQREDVLLPGGVRAGGRQAADRLTALPGFRGGHHRRPRRGDGNPGPDPARWGSAPWPPSGDCWTGWVMSGSSMTWWVPDDPD